MNWRGVGSLILWSAAGVVVVIGWTFLCWAANELVPQTWPWWD